MGIKWWLLFLVQAIEKELLERLQSGTYGDIYNFPMKEYEKVLEMEKMQAASEEEDNGEEVCKNFVFYDLLDDVIVISLFLWVIVICPTR